MLGKVKFMSRRTYLSTVLSNPMPYHWGYSSSMFLACAEILLIYVLYLKTFSKIDHKILICLNNPYVKLNKGGTLNVAGLKMGNEKWC